MGEDYIDRLRKFQWGEYGVVLAVLFGSRLGGRVVKGDWDLPSTVCPVCQHELTQEEGRIMICENCGYKAPRDLVPIHWAVRLIHQSNPSLATIQGWGFITNTVGT
jgi:hypothetical protein